jgi:hypothetical protein
MISFIVSTLASLVLLIGLISMVTPIPGGTLMIALSLTVLICSSSRARHYLLLLRTRVKWLNKSMTWIEETMGKRIGILGVALTG